MKELRATSGAGMMDCKGALAQNDNDLEKASVSSYSLVCFISPPLIFSSHSSCSAEVGSADVNFQMFIADIVDILTCAIESSMRVVYTEDAGS